MFIFHFIKFNINFQLFSNNFYFLTRIPQHFSGKYFYQNHFLLHKGKFDFFVVKKSFSFLSRIQQHFARK
jgi:hypothetical protein